MPLPSRRDPEELRAALQRWFRDDQPDAVVGPVSIPEGNGMSSETLLFEVTAGGRSEGLVARLRPDMSDWPVFPTYDLGKQAAAMRLVAERTDVPVPAVRAVVGDESVIGAPFLVMERHEGHPLCDLPPYTFGGSFLDHFTAEQRSEYQRNFMAVQAKIHSIQLTADEAAEIAPHADDLIGRQLDDLRNYYEWAREGTPYPVIDRGLDWLEANRPADAGPAVLLWGDSRPGNALAVGTTPTAILDWEMVDIGPAGVDVAWPIFMHRFFQSLAVMFEVPGFPDFFQPDQAVADYVAAGGRPIPDLEWFVMLASVRFAAISLRTNGRDVAYGNREAPAEPEDIIYHRALLEEQLGS